MGNSLIKHTNIEKEPLGNCGVNYQWTMHEAHRTDKLRTPVTVFMYKKKPLKKLPTNVKESFLHVLRKDPQMLSQYKHPNILTVMDNLMEDQKKMGFVTEKVLGSLHNFIQWAKVSSLFASATETKLHIIDLCEAVRFLHCDVRVCHLGISPENVYITPDGKWKLGGFSFATPMGMPGNVDTGIDFSLEGNSLHLTPRLNFTAPEVVSSSSNCSFAADVFSLGCIIYTIFKLAYDGDVNNPYLINADSVSGYQKAIKMLEKQNFSIIPQDFQPILFKMIHPDHTKRASMNDIFSASWFKDPIVQAYQCLETLREREYTQQQSFLKGFVKIVPQLEPRFAKTRILPLLNNLVKEVALASSILPIYFSMMQTPNYFTKEEFNNLIWPTLKALVTGKEIPGQALNQIIENTKSILQYVDPQDYQTLFVPLLGKSLGCGVQKIQIAALKKVIFIKDKVDYVSLKSVILPKVLKLCIDPNIDTRKVAVVVLSRIYQIFDKSVVNESILEALEKLRQLENNYLINMTVLKIYQGLAKNIGLEVKLT